MISTEILKLSKAFNEAHPTTRNNKNVMVLSLYWLSIARSPQLNRQPAWLIKNKDPSARKGIKEKPLVLSN